MKRDLVRIIEAAYAEAETEQDWVRGLAEAALPALDDGLGLAAYTFDLPENRPVWRQFVALGDDPEAITSCVQRLQTDAPAEVIVNAFNTNLATSLSSFLGADPAQLPFVGQHLARCGARDTMGIVAFDPRGGGVCLSPLFRQPRALTRTDQQTLLRIAAHLGAGFRLRSSSSAAEPDAVLDLGGQLHHAVGEARDRGARVSLRHAARAIDRARAQRTRDPEEAVAVWKALVSGRWSLVDRFESDGRQFLVARQNKLETTVVRALSERERQVVSLAARGHTNKLIAYELGIAVGTASTLLARAARKLGVASRVALIAEWQRLEQQED